MDDRRGEVSWIKYFAYYLHMSLYTQSKQLAFLSITIIKKTSESQAILPQSLRFF